MIPKMIQKTQHFTETDLGKKKEPVYHWPLLSYAK